MPSEPTITRTPDAAFALDARRTVLLAHLSGARL
jgi:hypothetical protein